MGSKAGGSGDRRRSDGGKGGKRAEVVGEKRDGGKEEGGTRGKRKRGGEPKVGAEL